MKSTRITAFEKRTGLPSGIRKIKRDRSRSKNPTPVAAILTKDNVQEAIANLIAEQPNITDLICIYHTRSDKTDCISTSMEIERATYMLDHIKFMYHAAEATIEGLETEEEEDG